MVAEYNIMQSDSTPSLGTSIRPGHVVSLEADRTLKTAQVYALTSTIDEKEVEESYPDVDSILQLKSKNTAVIGGFNAKFWCNKTDEK